MSDKNYILNASVASKKLRRLALEIVERNYDVQQLVLVGIKHNGSVIAEKISAFMKEFFKGEVLVLELSIDKKKPGVITLNEHINFNDKIVLLVDDVANTGRTMLYALKLLLEYYPRKIQTLALVERTHKAFPIKVDYVGLSISTALSEHICVEVQNGEVKGAWMKG